MSYPIPLWRKPVVFTVAVLISSLAAPLAAQQANPAWLRPGAVHLALTNDSSSSVNLDLGALDQSDCGGGTSMRSVGARSMPPSGEECRLVVGQGGNGGTLPDGGPPPDFRLQVLRITADRGGCGTLVEVMPASLSLFGEEPLDLSCGSRPFAIGLSSRGPQPTSWLHLLAGDPSAATGWFVGTLGIDAEARIGGMGESGARQDLPLRLEISGRWTALNAASIPNLPSSLSTLVLFVEKVGSTWQGKISCGQDQERCGRLCFEAASTGLAWLPAGDPDVW